MTFVAFPLDLLTCRHIFDRQASTTLAEGVCLTFCQLLSNTGLSVRLRVVNANAEVVLRQSNVLATQLSCNKMLKLLNRGERAN